MPAWLPLTQTWTLTAFLDFLINWKGDKERLYKDDLCQGGAMFDRQVPRAALPLPCSGRRLPGMWGG